jgi:hypothetical protein
MSGDSLRPRAELTGVAYHGARFSGDEHRFVTGHVSECLERPDDVEDRKAAIDDERDLHG